MWSNFYAAGGWGMFPVSLFGFFLLASSVLHAVRPSARTARLVIVLGLVTFASGLLGATVGICNTFHFLPEVTRGDQVQIAALGVEESLHDVVLALMLDIVAGLVAIVGALRARDVLAPVPAE